MPYFVEGLDKYKKLYCFLFKESKEIGDDKFLIAVMDGCTIGTDSHFASTLIGEILKNNLGLERDEILSTIILGVVDTGYNRPRYRVTMLPFEEYIHDKYFRLTKRLVG